jgi:hypothetical protein
MINIISLEGHFAAEIHNIHALPEPEQTFKPSMLISSS